MLAVAFASVGGCSGPGGVPASLKMRIAQKNEGSLQSKVELSLVKLSDTRWAVKLVNNGSSKLRVIPPMMGHTVTIHFFDGSGEEIAPSRKIESQRPFLTDSVVTPLGPHDELETEFDRSSILDELGGLDNCKFIVAVYHPLYRALELLTEKIDLRESVFWSNATEW